MYRMVRRLGLAMFVGLLAVGAFVIASRHSGTEPRPLQHPVIIGLPNLEVVPRLGPMGVFCLLGPSGSPRCSQEPPWRRQPSGTPAAARRSRNEDPEAFFNSGGRYRG